MDTSESSKIDDIPRVEVEAGTVSTTPVTFPTTESNIPQSSSSLLTHSDKLSELPSATPPVGRVRTPSRPRRTDASVPVQPSSPSLGHLAKAASEEGGQETPGKETPRGRVSFDESDRASLPSFQKLREAVSRVAASRQTHSDPNLSPPAKDHQRAGSSPSRSSSRAQSPLRMFWPLYRLHSREEPFVPVDPYRFLLFPASLADSLKQKHETLAHVLDQLLRQAYRHALLRLPSIYFSRVCRLFEDAEVSRPEIMRMIAGVQAGAELPAEWTPPVVSPALVRFKMSWEEFVESVMREWKTLNVVSALLLSAILTLFQIQDAANGPVTRPFALLSLIAALWSLSFGCVYILRFGTMRSMYKASQWAEEAQKTKTLMWWNVWVLLAMPAVWLAWSMIFFCIAILAYVWSTGSRTDVITGPSPRAELAPRIAVSIVFAVGLVYFALIIRTFKAYGGKRGHGHKHWDSARRAAGHGDAGGLRVNGNAASGGVRVSGEWVGGVGWGAARQERSDGGLQLQVNVERDLEKGEAVEERGRRVSPRL